MAQMQLTVSAHKINGLKGSGVLAMRKGIVPKAINYGGGQEKGIRSGTVSVPDATALAKAMRLTVPHKNLDSIDSGEMSLLITLAILKMYISLQKILAHLIYYQLHSFK